MRYVFPEMHAKCRRDAGKRPARSGDNPPPLAPGVSEKIG